MSGITGFSPVCSCMQYGWYRNQISIQQQRYFEKSSCCNFGLVRHLVVPLYKHPSASEWLEQITVTTLHYVAFLVTFTRHLNHIWDSKKQKQTQSVCDIDYTAVGSWLKFDQLMRGKMQHSLLRVGMAICSLVRVHMLTSDHRCKGLPGPNLSSAHWMARPMHWACEYLDFSNGTMEEGCLLTFAFISHDIHVDVHWTLTTYTNIAADQVHPLVAIIFAYLQFPRYRCNWSSVACAGAGPWQSIVAPSYRI